MAGVLCYRPGARPHLLYRLRPWHGRKRRSSTWTEYRDLILATHHRLKAPQVWIWDNLNVHKTHELVEFIDANRDWPRVVHLPSYAPDLNPTEGGVVSCASARGRLRRRDLDHLVRVVKRKLKKIQYRPDVVDGCLAYALSGKLRGGLCGRRLDSHRVHDRPAYRCRHGHSSIRTRPENTLRNLYLREG
jgi:transposase